LNPNVAEVIEDRGLEVYPFTPKKLDELAVIDKAKLEAVLLNGENDFVTDKSGSKVIFFCSKLILHLVIGFTVYMLPIT